MILLDTNAIVWTVTRHRRGRLLRAATDLAISPASLLELNMLVALGRIRVRLQDVLDDERWTVDDPPALEWFTRAADEGWTRDPFDRLIVAHARLRRARLATADRAILEHLRSAEVLPL
jgi:PIN domain nuclease of toxin-antitoxin system